MSAGLILKNVDDVPSHWFICQTRYCRFHQTLMLRAESIGPCRIQRDDGATSIWSVDRHRKGTAQRVRR